MRNTIRFKNFLAAGLFILLVSCNNSSKKDGSAKIDTSVAAVPSSTPPAIVETTTPVKKCFQNDGLKYKTTITISNSSPAITGNVVSEALDSGAKETADFSGTIADDKLTIKFTGNPPVIGAASEWTKKPWTLKKTGDKETLLIVFNAKNYDSNKWEETTFEFTSCK